MRLHKFRSTRATEWLRKGIDIPTVGDLLGHKDYRSVEAYLKHLRQDELVASESLPRGRESTSRLGSVLSIAGNVIASLSNDEDF